MRQCPSCGNDVSPQAYDCPHCGHPLRKAKRGFMGSLFKWSLIGFNILCLIWLFSYWGEAAPQVEAGSEAQQAGAAIGMALGTGTILFFWVCGNVILGLATLLTRPSK